MRWLRDPLPDLDMKYGEAGQVPIILVSGGALFLLAIIVAAFVVRGKSSTV
jgi:hypothetical protein